MQVNCKKYGGFLIMEAFQDVFFEQLISLRKTGGDWAKVCGIWTLAILLAAAIFLFLPIPLFSLLAIAGIFFGAYKWTQRFSIEYEYSVTNGTMDVTKIYARSSRKYELGLDLSKVERLEKYDPSKEIHGNYKKTVFACDRDDTNAYFMVVTEEAKGSRALIFAPNDRLKKAIAKGLPKFLALSAFKD